MSRPFPARSRRCLAPLALACALVVALGVPASVEAAPPPTQLDLGPDAHRPVVPGERSPGPDAKLPTALAPVKPKPKPAPKVRPEPKPVVLAPRVRRRERVPDLIVQVDGGRVSVPRSIVALAAQADHFPDLMGYALDITVLKPATARHAFGARLGLLVPLVPAANWYQDGPDAKRPVFTELDVVGLDLAFEYLYRRKVVGPVGFFVRAGLGLAFAIGSVRRTETLPTCAPEQFARCPHWRRAGTQPNTLPSPVWPALRATGGLFVDLGRHLSLSFEGGLRDALYVGGGVAFRK